MALKLSQNVVPFSAMNPHDGIVRVFTICDASEWAPLSDKAKSSSALLQKPVTSRCGSRYADPPDEPV